MHKVYIDGILQTKCKGFYHGSNDIEEPQGSLMADWPWDVRHWSTELE